VSHRPFTAPGRKVNGRCETRPTARGATDGAGAGVAAGTSDRLPQPAGGVKHEPARTAAYLMHPRTGRKCATRAKKLRGERGGVARRGPVYLAFARLRRYAHPAAASPARASAPGSGTGVG